MSRAQRKRSKKEFLSTWAFDAFDGDPSFCTKRMFGCLAAYVRGRIVMVLTEDPGDQSYRGEKYSFDLWDGILLPTEKIFHESLMKEFSGLKPHPVLGKWLYLPAADETFEARAREIGEHIAGGDLRLGVDPKVKVARSR
jgi:hypothetical protein